MTTPGTTRPSRLRAAFVRRAHGVHGEVRADALGGDWRRFTRGVRVGVEEDGRQLTVRAARDGGNGSVLLAFDEIADPAAAQALRGHYLDVDASVARTLGADEWFTWQLTGLRVCTPAGDVIGVVADVEPAVSNDVLVVAAGDGERRYPMVRAFVKAVDVDAGVLILEPQDEVQT